MDFAASRKRHAELPAPIPSAVQCILDREIRPGIRQLDVCLFALILRQVNSTPSACSCRSVRFADRPPACRRRTSCTGTLRPRSIFSRRSIIQIDNALPAHGEQQRLGLAVLLHGLVEIEVILRQIGERSPTANGDAVYAVQAPGQCEETSMITCVQPAVCACWRNSFVQLEGFRRGALGGRSLCIADQVLVGADQAHLVRLRPQACA